MSAAVVRSGYVQALRRPLPAQLAAPLSLLSADWPAPVAGPSGPRPARVIRTPLIRCLWVFLRGFRF